MSTADVRFDIAQPIPPKGDLGDAPVRAPRDEREPFAKTLERSRRARPEDDPIDRDAPVNERREAKGGDEKVEARDKSPRATRRPRARRRGARTGAPRRRRMLDTLIDDARSADAVTGPRDEAPARGGGGRQRPRGLGPLDACLSFAPGGRGAHRAARANRRLRAFARSERRRSDASEGAPGGPDRRRAGCAGRDADRAARGGGGAGVAVPRCRARARWRG